MHQMTEEVKKTSYKPLWWLIALCAFPYIAGTLYYQSLSWFPRAETTNHGTLVEPVRELSGISFEMSDGSQKSIEDYRRKWLMMYLLDDSCQENCQKNIYFMRQVRKAMGQDRFRISRLMILDRTALHDAELAAFLEDYPGLEVATVSVDDKARLAQLLEHEGGDIYRKIMLVDPLGNYMMRYPVELDPKLFLKDIKRLLSVSRIG